MGIKRKKERTFSRDINITFTDFKWKEEYKTWPGGVGGGGWGGKWILTIKKIPVFPDLPSEALSIRRELKPVIQKLQKSKIRYWWTFPGKLMVIHKNKQFFAWDLRLWKWPWIWKNWWRQKLKNIPQKWKLVFQLSPFKGSKILVRSSTGSEETWDSLGSQLIFHLDQGNITLVISQNKTDISCYKEALVMVINTLICIFWFFRGKRYM